MKRHVPLRKKRPGPPRRGEPTAEEKEAMREHIHELSGGMCELRLVNCMVGPLPLEGDVFTRGHLVHMGAKRRFGWPISGPRRMRWGCHSCHILQMHQKGTKPQPLTKGE